MSRDKKRIRVELLRYLKGSKLWEAGTVFDTAKGPLPKDILHEVELARKNPKVAKVRFLDIPDEEDEPGDPRKTKKTKAEADADAEAAEEAARLLAAGGGSGQ